MVYRPLFYSLIISTTALCGLALANPEGGEVVGGVASIHEQGKTLEVRQLSEQTVLDWQSFDIAAQEHTRFIQPSSKSIALNRIQGGDPSQIHGRLSANGMIILSNPNGVWFGPTSRVDVQALIATTAEIASERFMAGAPAFEIPGQPDAVIANEGHITAGEAGLVGLVAPTVINRGVIEAKLGRVQLASGGTATVDLYGDGLFEFVLGDEAARRQLVANRGILRADGGKVVMTAAAARNIVDSLIVAGGLVQAQSVQQKQGKIVISAEGAGGSDHKAASRVLVDGILDASGRDAGEQGGQVTIVGDHVALSAKARLDASGHSAPVKHRNQAGSASLGADQQVRSEADFLADDRRAGGSIKIGGDYLGQGNMPTAESLSVAPGAVILNEAIDYGDGGRTILWSDQVTDFRGLVLSRGGEEGGHGGFVETSGKQTLRAQGLVDLSPRAGGYSKGTYLLDPANITIFGNEASAFSVSALIGHWNFDGDVEDQTSNNNDGTNNGAIFTGSGAPTPQYNTNSLEFDGNNDYVVTGPDTTISGSSPWTLSYWANIDSSESGGGRQAWPIWKGPSGQSSNQLIGVAVDGGDVEIANWGNDFTFNAPVDFDNWQNVVVTYDGVTNQDVYLNGVFADSRNSAGSLNVNSDRWFFGGRPGREFTDGRLDDVRIYDTVLSSAQIEEINGNRFTVAGLEWMSQFADINLQATNTFKLDLDGDNLNINAGQSISLSTINGNILDVSSGSISTNNGDITLAANGSGDINLGSTELNTTAGGWVELTAGGDIDLVQNGPLNLGSVSGMNVNIQTLGAAGDIILNDTVTATATGNAMTLASGRNFINNHGSGALNTPGGRFLVYSKDPQADTRGSQSFDFKRYDKSIGDPVLAGVNGFIYSIAPSLAIVINDASRPAGAANPSFSFSLDPSGLIDGDSAAVALGSAPILTTGATSLSPAGSYPITAGPISSPLGYSINLTEGTLNIAEAPVTSISNSQRNPTDQAVTQTSNAPLIIPDLFTDSMTGNPFYDSRNTHQEGAAGETLKKQSKKQTRWALAGFSGLNLEADEEILRQLGLTAQEFAQYVAIQ